MRIEITPTHLCIDGHVYARGLDRANYVTQFGEPDRDVELGPPAPFGHKNNRALFYDSWGIFLAEHHYSCLIQSVGIVLDREHAYRKSQHAFSGDLVVCGVAMSQGMRPDEFLARCDVPFRRHLGHSLVYDAENLSIDIDYFHELTKSGRKSRKTKIAVVSVGFANAHRRAGQ